MPCLLLIAVLLFPRVVLVLMFLLSNYPQRAFHYMWVLPLVGFLFLPVTTIVYAWEVNSGFAMEGVYLLVLIAAVIIDVGGWGGGAYHRRRV
ncbi:MAG TPA: hypothetical protein VKV17_03045 [Bryobacteraceae bacterium]|nr:hypothetical protein [Bryobacteraceae bacterium]